MVGSSFLRAGFTSQELLHLGVPCSPFLRLRPVPLIFVPFAQDLSRAQQVSTVKKREERSDCHKNIQFYTDYVQKNSLLIWEPCTCV